MRITTLIALLALSGYAALASAAKEPANSQARDHSMIDRGGKEVAAQKDTGVVRTRGGSSFFTVSDILGRG